MAKKYDVVGLGAALVDVLTHADDEFIQQHGIEKDAMNLIDAERSAVLYAALGDGIEVSGGSVANSIVGVASAGRRGAFIGRVRDDRLGSVFAKDLQRSGVDYLTEAADAGSGTGRCLVIVTPDSHRTMNTYLGAATELIPDDIDFRAITDGSVLFIEGYVLDYAAGPVCIEQSIAAAKSAGAKVALTLSDSFLVQRHKDLITQLVKADTDILFANEKELIAITGIEDGEEALAVAPSLASVVAVTRSERGSVVFDNGTRYDAEAIATEVADVTGAGDLYAAGFLAAYTAGRPAEEWGRWGGLAASEVISHLGARPQVELTQLLN